MGLKTKLKIIYFIDVELFSNLYKQSGLKNLNVTTCDCLKSMFYLAVIVIVDY